LALGFVGAPVWGWGLRWKGAREGLPCFDRENLLGPLRGCWGRVLVVVCSSPFGPIRTLAEPAKPSRAFALLIVASALLIVGRSVLQVCLREVLGVLMMGD